MERKRRPFSGSLLLSPEVDLWSALASQWKRLIPALSQCQSRGRLSGPALWCAVAGAGGWPSPGQTGLGEGGLVQPGRWPLLIGGEERGHF